MEISERLEKFCARPEVRREQKVYRFSVTLNGKPQTFHLSCLSARNYDWLRRERQRTRQVRLNIGATLSSTFKLDEKLRQTCELTEQICLQFTCLIEKFVFNFLHHVESLPARCLLRRTCAIAYRRINIERALKRDLCSTNLIAFLDHLTNLILSTKLRRRNQKYFDTLYVEWN